MWRSLYPRMFFRSSVHCSSYPKMFFRSSVHCSSSSTIPSPYHFRRSFFLSSPNYSSAASSLIQEAKDLPRMKAWVWWNLENSCLPSGFDMLTVVESLQSAIEDYHGLDWCTVEVNVYGDLSQLPTEDRKEVASEFKFNHIPKGGNDTVQSFLIFDILDWVSQNHAPVLLYFIPPVDSNLDSVLQHLKRNKYSVWLATVETMDPEILKKRDSSMESIMWRLRSYQVPST